MTRIKKQLVPKSKGSKKTEETYVYVITDHHGNESEVTTKQTAIAASDELTRQHKDHTLQARFNGGWLTFNNKSRHWE